MKLFMTSLLRTMASTQPAKKARTAESAPAQSSVPTSRDLPAVLREKIGHQETWDTWVVIVSNYGDGHSVYESWADCVYLIPAEKLGGEIPPARGLSFGWPDEFEKECPCLRALLQFDEDDANPYYVPDFQRKKEYFETLARFSWKGFVIIDGNA